MFWTTPEIGKKMRSELLPKFHWTIHIFQVASHLNISVNQGHLENGTYEQIVTHLEREIELNGLNAPDELQMNSVTQKQQTEGKKDNAGNSNSDTNNSINSNPENNKNDRTFKAVCLPCGTRENTNQSTEKCYYWGNAANRPLPWKSKPALQNGPQLQDEQNKITEITMAATQSSNWIYHVFSSGTACDRPENAKFITLSPIPEVVSQQPPQTTMDIFKPVNTINNPTTVTTQNIQTPEPRHWNDVELQMSSPKEILLQISRKGTEQFREKETRNESVPFPNNSENCQNDTQKRNANAEASCNGRDNIPPLTKTAPQIEDRGSACERWKY